MLAHLRYRHDIIQLTYKSRKFVLLFKRIEVLDIVDIDELKVFGWKML